MMYMKMKASPQCSYCDEINYFSQLFFHCPNARHLWYLLFFIFKSMNDDYEVLNFCMLNIKYDIYKQHLFHDNTMSIREICNDIRYKLVIEKKISENEYKRVNNEVYHPVQ